MATFPAYGGARPLKHPPAHGEGSVWGPLRERLFLALWIAALASNVGTWMQNVGAAWLMTTLSPSPLVVSLIQTATSMPIFLLALPAGALADVIDRRRLLLFSQGWMLLAARAIQGAGGALAWQRHDQHSQPQERRGELRQSLLRAHAAVR